MFEGVSFVLPVKFKTKWFAERCQRSFGGVRFGSLERNVMHFGGRGPPPFSRAVAFAHNGRAIGVHGNAHLGRIDGQKRPSVFACQDAAGLYRLAVPGIKTKDAIGFRDREPAFDVGELTTIGHACADVPAVEAAPQRLHLFCREAHHRVLTLRTGSGSERATPLMSAPSLSSLSKPSRLSRGGTGCQ